MKKAALLLLVTLLTLSVAAQDDDNGNGDAGMSNRSDGMGGEMLGGSAETTKLAAQEVDALPEEPLAWVVFDLAGVEHGITITGPAPAFVYAREGSHEFIVSGEETTLEEGQATYVDQGDELSLASGEGLWYSVLANPDGEAPARLEDAEVVAESDELDGLPQASAQLSFVLVELPTDSATAVHSHPGPEYIHVTQGEIEYQTGMTETENLSVGDSRALPADVAVQKRNPMGEMAAFVSWFVVDPEEPFATEAEFD